MHRKSRFLVWLSHHRLEVAFLALLLVLTALRGYWTPDEPDFAQCVKEMRLRGTWMFPWLNGEVYTEKPILFYWLMKGAAIGAEKLTGGMGFARGIAPWALRLPSVLAAAGLVFGARAWARRFLDAQTADMGALILATTPIWLWQGQFIQIDMVFAVLLSWSWMCWISGYALLRGVVPRKRQDEPRRWFMAGYLALGLAVLAKGPLALVLSGAVVIAFLAWQRDWHAVRSTWLLPGLGLLLGIILPWYVAAGLKGGPQYAYAMIIHQNVSRAMNAWDHIQPWWRYISYLAADFFPWSLLVPATAVVAYRNRASLTAVERFTILAWAVPFLLLSLSKSKQGKYILMTYPFLAMMLASSLQRLSENSINKLRRMFGLAFAIPGIALLLVSVAHVGGAKLLAQAQSFLGPIRLAGILLLAGGLWIWSRVQSRDSRKLILHTAVPLAAVFTLVVPWTFVRLDPLKDYQGWACQTEPLLANHRVYFWSEIRSGATVYSDRILPVLTSPTQLAALGPDDLLIATNRRWKPGIQGLDIATIRKFHTIYRQPQGGDGLQILKPSPSEPLTRIDRPTNLDAK